MLIKNVAYGTYLQTNSAGSLHLDSFSSTDSDRYQYSRWRMASTDYYGNSGTTTKREFSSGSYFPDLEVTVDTSKTITITKGYQNEIWCSPSIDFTYSYSSDRFSLSSATVTGIKRGEGIITATHKVTGRVLYLDVFVSNAYWYESEKTEVRNGIRELVGDGYIYLPLYNDNDAEYSINRIIEYDRAITESANRYRIPKEFIQSVLFREIWCYSMLDHVGDSAV